MVGTKEALGALAYKDRWANIRVASDFADSGCGTTTDPWVNGINEAIADAVAGGIGTPSIFLPAGSYTIDEPIKIDTELTIHSPWERGAVIKLADGANCNMIEIGGVNKVDAMELWGLYLNGNHSNQTGSRHGILIKNAANVVIKDCFIRCIKGDGIRIDTTGANLWDITIQKCFIFENQENGIHYLGTDNHATWSSYIKHCTIRANVYNGISIEGGHFSQLEGQFNRIWMLTNNICDNDKNGIHIADTANIYIRGNELYRNSYHNIGIYDDIAIEKLKTFDPFNIDIIHNHFAYGSTQKYIIDLCDIADYVKITNNIIRKMGNIATQPINIPAGANVHGEIANNMGWDRYPLLKERVYNTGSSTWGWMLIVPFDCIVKKAYMIASTYPAGGEQAFMRIKKVDMNGDTTDIVSAVTIAGLTNHSKKEFTLASTTLSKGDRIYTSPYGTEIANLLHAIITIEMG